MAISTSKPVVIPATNYNLVAIKNLTINWPDLNGPVMAGYNIKQYATDGQGQLHESPTAPIHNVIKDVFATAAERAKNGKPALATAVQAILTAVQEIETERGNI